MNKPHEYAAFVIHPRYGQQPRMTGLNPETDYGGDVFLHWHSPRECRIPNTAIPADTSRQLPATVPVTHYFDAKRICRDCARPFIFFAEEQKYWYEELQFPLESDCVRCIDCRKKQQGLAFDRERYEELFTVPDRTADQNLELVERCLTLIEAGLFHPRKTEYIRMIINKLQPPLLESHRERLENISRRLSVIASFDSKPSAASSER